MFRHVIRGQRPEEENPEASRALTVIVWVFVSVFPLLLAALIALPQFSTRWLLLLGAVYAICIPTFLLNRRGYARFAGIFLVVGLWVLITGAALTAGGIGSFAALFYLVIVSVAGLVLGSRAAIVSALACILTALGLVVIEMAGYMPSSVIPHTPFSRWIALTLLTILMICLQYLSLQRVHDALKQSREELDERQKTQEELQRVSERLQVATRAANIGIWDWDVKNDELVWDDAMYRLYGLRKEDFSGAFEAWAKSLAPEDFDRANDEVEAALRGDREFAAEFRIVWPDGSVHFTKAAAQTFRDEAGSPLRMVGLNYDITERKQAEERIALLQMITIDIAAAPDLPAALEVVLRRVCEKTGWALGQAWLPNEEGTALSCCPAWFAAATNLEDFRARTKDFAFPAGVGLPGRVWALGRPVWIADVTQDTNFPRAEFARKSGLKAGLGVPIRSGEEVIAVLEFYLRETRDEDVRLVKVISGVAAQIGLMVERRRAEDALRESEAKFRVLTETAASAILIYQDDKYRYANPAAEAITGYQMGEILSMNLVGAVHPDFQELIRGRARARQRGEDVPARYEVKIITKSGEERWLDSAASNMEFEGRPAVLVTAFDVTERKRAEEALQRNEELFRAIVEDQTEMIVRWKPDGTRTFVNNAYCRVFRGNPEDFVGTSFYPLVAENYRDRIVEKVRSLTPENPLATGIHESKLEDGELRWQEWTDRGVFDAQGQLVELQSTGRDITERKRAEEALRLSEHRSRRIVEVAPEAIVVVDLALKSFVDFNPQALALFKLSADEILRVGPTEMSPARQPDGRLSSEVATAYINQALAGETPVFEWTHRNSRGEDIPCEVRLLQLPDQSRLLVRGTIIDITERKQAEARLLFSREQLRALSERLRRAKEDEGIRIARELHDELGSALTSLKWSLLGLKKVPGPRSSGTLEKIGEMVELVDATITAVRRISSELRPGVLDDLGLISAIEWHAQQFQGHSEIACECESLVDDVDLNREQATVVFRILQEATTNVLRHAQATKVNIIIEEEDGELVLEVRDNGRGITELEKLGTLSLGLLGMRERASSIGGTIDITGSPGRGTRLCVRLPINREAGGSTTVRED